MKQQIQMIAMITVVFTSPAALAEVTASKPATRIDFNKMIEDNNNTRQDLQKDIDRATEKQAAKTPGKKEDKAKAIDFIDVEIGVGQSPSIVDRRYDSVGEAKLAQDQSLDWIKVAVLKVFSKIP